VIDEFGPDGNDISAEFERKMVQVTHGEVSAMVLAHWTLPETVCQAVNLHQSSNPGEGVEGTLARILHSSDRMARLLCKATEAHQAIQVCQEAMALVDVEPGVLLRVLPTVERDIEELADALRIDVVSSDSYKLIAQALQESLTSTTTG
jgi:HD-like signal output (HDOD) protein